MAGKACLFIRFGRTVLVRLQCVVFGRAVTGFAADSFVLLLHVDQKVLPDDRILVIRGQSDVADKTLRVELLVYLCQGLPCL